MLASAVCRGRFGYLRNPYIQVSVYADRMTVRALLMKERTINRSDIREVSEGRQLGRPRFIIDHTAGWWSPVVLYWLDDEVKAAIHRIKPEKPRRQGPPEEFWYS